MNALPVSMGAETSNALIAENAYTARGSISMSFLSENALLITVEDTGIGISKDNLEHIYDNGFSTKGEGRGTGLYQVREMVDAIGGKITVESQENVGTSFTVSFSK